MSEATLEPDGNVTEEVSSPPQPERIDAGPAPVESVTEDAEGDDSREKFIPRSRFDEINQRMQTAEERARAAEQQVQAFQNWYLAHKDQLDRAVIEPASDSPPNGQTHVEESAEETVIRDALGRDDAGQKAFELMERHFAHRKGTEGLVTEDRMRQAVEQAVQRVRGEWNTTVQTANRFQGWVQQGRLSPEQAGELNRTLSSWIKARPEAAADPATVDMWASHLYMQELEAGRIQPVSRPANTPPMGPATPGRPPAPAPVELTGAARRFSRLRGMSEDQLKTIAAESERRHSGAHKP